MMKKRDQLFSDYLNCESDDSWEEYRKARNRVNSAQRAATREYFGEKLKSQKENIRGTWLTIKSVLGNGKDSASTEQLAIGERTVSGRQEVNEEF
ncbi:hypothetical protein QYM36_009108, partial [Artemia franciscana]